MFCGTASQIYRWKGFEMIVSVGIDVSKDKHDCFIQNSASKVLAEVFTIPNNMDGFRTLLENIRSCTSSQDKIKVGLEATGHYSYNILGFLLDNGLATYVLNPLLTNLYRKSLSLRKTKTDRVNARTIAAMLLSDVGLKPYTDTAYHNEELKSLTRYRFDKVKERAKLKSSVSRLVCILFPELEKLAPTLQMASIYALLEKMPAKSLELQHAIRLIRELDAEITGIETEIETMMNNIQSPITTIPGIGCRMGAMILAEAGDLSRFDSPDKLLAYAGMSPSTYQSGQLKNCYPHMEKRGSRYLRYALYNAAKYVCLWNSTFAAYLAKKRAEGKHHNVAISHAAKKLVRLIFAMEKSRQPYCSAA